MSKARTIQKQVTRPTSVAIMLVLFQGFKLVFPNRMPDEWQEFTYNVITVIGGTGLLDKLWTNRKEIIKFVSNIFKRKNNGKP